MSAQLEDWIVEFDASVRNGFPKPRRSMAPMRYYGGKGRMIKRLLPLLPVGRVYVEPYCGAASLFFAKKPSGVEVLNDINEDIVNVFRVLQDPETFKRFAHRLTWTPYSRSEFIRALNTDSDDPVDRAWACFVRHNQSLSGQDAKAAGAWSRCIEKDDGTGWRWSGRLYLLDRWHKRLSRVQIENRDALEVIDFWDSPETVFYCDPPYIHDTRANGARAKYRYEADITHHERLVEKLLNIRGQCMLSGYSHPLYNVLEEAGWEKYQWEVACHAAGRVRGTRLRGTGSAKEVVPRIECVWIKRSKDCLFD